MGHEAGRRILADMGINVWVLRRGPSDATSKAVAKSAANSATKSATKSAANSSTKPAAKAPAAPSPVPAPVVEPAAPRTPETATPGRGGMLGGAREPAPVAPEQTSAGLHVQCLVGARALLLVDDITDSRRRLVLDVLAAASGGSTEVRKELTFRWRGEVTTQWSAFAAFVDKQLVDYAPRVLLCSSSLAGRLPDESSALPVIELPPLEQLGRNAGQKRELWQQIQSLPA